MKRALERAKNKGKTLLEGNKKKGKAQVEKKNSKAHRKAKHGA